MKVVNRHFVLGFVLALICDCGNLHAQSVWVPMEISIEVPIMAHYFDYGTDGVGKIITDSSGIKKIILNFSRNIHSTVVITNSGRINDSIFSTATDGGGSPPDTVHFIFDSLYGKIKNFYFGHSYSATTSPPYSIHQRSSRIFFHDLNFQIMPNDSILIVNTSGKLCRESFDSAQYYNLDYVTAYTRNGHLFSIDTTYSLYVSEDTLSYKCTITFNLNRLNSSVQNLKLFQANTINSLSYTDHFIHFTFPSSMHSQPLLIYDILGREIYRTEITPGTTQFTLPTSQFVSGHYFARLGNMTAHFAVY